VLVGRPELDREDGLLPLLGDHLAELYGMARPCGDGWRSVAVVC
jgi:hypothetical protein